MRTLAVLIVFSFLATSCATELNETQSGALLGSGLGAGLGAIIGSQSGHTGAGTAIGAGSGLLIGALLGEGIKRQGEKVKRELAAEQSYYGQPTTAYTQTTGRTQEVHTKYNPRTGQTFPERYKFDPNSGEELLPIP